MDEENSRRGAQTWSEYESQRQQDEAALPDAVKAILEACRDRSNETSLSSEDREKLPYPCRIYEAVQGEEELLQLQWMRVDMSTMDGDRCWGDGSSSASECPSETDSGLMVPGVYRVDPAQLFPLTFVGLPPELMLPQHHSDWTRRQTVEELPEDYLCKIGSNLTEVLSKQVDEGIEELAPEVVAEVAALSGADWSACIESHINLSRCDSALFVGVLAACVPPTLHCLMGTVLPWMLTRFRENGSAPDSKEGGEREVADAKLRSTYTSRDAAAIRTICRLAATVAVEEGRGSAWWRKRVSASGLRKLGPLGREAEVALAEAFFYRTGGAAK